MRVGLIENATSGTLTFTRTINDRVEVTVFNGLAATTNPGGFISHTDVNGGKTVVASQTGSQINELQRSYTVAGITTLDSLLYSYFTTGSASGKTQSVTYRRKVGSGPWISIQQVSYAYYGATDSNGNSNDLRTAARQLPDGSGGWNVVSIQYYRYYLPGDPHGIPHGLKMCFGPEAYRLMFNAGIDLTTASDSTVLPYADYYFEYDSATRQVTKEISAVCISCPGGGTTTDAFSYTKNPRNPAPGFNTWGVKTIQTLPDDSQIIVYSNYAGLPMLGVNVDATGTRKWGRFYRYDVDGRRTWKAQPSALALPSALSIIEAFDDLLNYDASTGRYQYVKNSDGLIESNSYYSATNLPLGQVQGYVSIETVQQGQTGTPVMIKAYTYTSNTDTDGVTIYPVETQTLYPVAGSSTPSITTSYNYTFYSGTNFLQQKITTVPVVSSSQNGDGSSPTVIQEFDNCGNLIARTDERGIVNQFTYDITTGVRIQQVLNVQSGVVAPGVNLTSNFEYDSLGRLVKTLGPAHDVVLSGVATTVRQTTWNVYLPSPLPTSGTWDVDQTWLGRGYATGVVSSYVYELVNPVTIVKADKDGRATDQITSRRTSGAGGLAPSDTFAQGDWRSWFSTQYNEKHRRLSERAYFDIPSSGNGTVASNYGQRDYGYDALERLNRVVAPGGTITRTVWEAPQRIASAWVGTDDSGATDTNPGGSGSPNNMVQVVENQYDGGNDGGNGDLTAVTQYVSGASGDVRITSYGYDFRDRRISEDGEVDLYVSYTYDNLGRVTQVDRYNATGSGNLVGRRVIRYDDRSRVYEQTTYAVDPSTGAVGNSLTTSSWYDYAGNLLQELKAGDGHVFTKKTYNGIGWATGTFRGYNTSGTSFSQASSTANDVVLAQILDSYDEAGNLIGRGTCERLNDAPSTGTGSTGALSNGTQPKGRTSYIAIWYDGIDRSIASANVGAQSSYSRPTTPPSSSSSTLVVSVDYDDAGRPRDITDAMDTVTRTTYDATGRKTQVVEDYSAAPGHLNRTMEYTFTLDDFLASQTAINADTGNQTTNYTYGTSLSESSIARNDLLRFLDYPDSISASDRISYAYNRQGQVRTITDQRGTVRTRYYDKLGRPTNDCVTNVGASTDSAVLQVATSYEVRGMVHSITSTDSATQGGGTILNQVQLEFNNFGQLIAEWQAHSGAVTSATPKVQYAYESGASNSNNVRPIFLTYPNGRTITYGYGTAGGMDDYLGRVITIVDGATTLAAYTYLGITTPIQIEYPEPDVRLDLWGGASGIFAGFDQFNRVIDQLWQGNVSGTPTDVDRYRYGYDQNANRLWKQNTITTGLDEYYEFDKINRLTLAQRGVLNSSHTGISGIPAQERDYSLDAADNWIAYLLKTSGTTILDQDRAHNVVNEITSVTANGGTPVWVTPAYDAAGNTAVFPQEADPTQPFAAVYDAWNRLAAINNTSGSVRVYSYDGKGRRIVSFDATETRHLYYTASWQRIEEHLGISTTAEIQYVWGLRYADELICRDDASSTRLYALQDAHFNVTCICDDSGNVLERFAYEPYGRADALTSGWVPTTDAFNWCPRAQGGVIDLVTGLYLFRNRDYSATIGRWLERDKLTYMAGPNLYAYLASNPLSFLDPLGLKTIRQPIGNGGTITIEIPDSPPGRTATPDENTVRKERVREVESHRGECCSVRIFAHGAFGLPVYHIGIEATVPNDDDECKCTEWRIELQEAFDGGEDLGKHDNSFEKHPDWRWGEGGFEGLGFGSGSAGSSSPAAAQKASVGKFGGSWDHAWGIWTIPDQYMGPSEDGSELKTDDPDEQCDLARCILATAQQVGQNANNSGTRYNLLARNSNSFAGEVLRHCAAQHGAHATNPGMFNNAPAFGNSFSGTFNEH